MPPPRPPSGSHAHGCPASGHPAGSPTGDPRRPRRRGVADALTLSPVIEIGLRHDGGDAETGAGVDVGSGIVIAAPSSGLAVDVRVRMLLMHQAEGFREHGTAVSVSYDPTPATPLGLSARIAPSWAHRPPAA